MKILIVEDEETLRKPVRRYLEAKQFIVDEAENGKEAIELLHINEYDCILLDLNLPEIDGLNVSKILRQEGNITPIIMLTARSQMYDKIEGFDNGADDYITKPFNLSEVTARIKAVIRRSSSNKSDRLTFGLYEVDVNNNQVLNNSTGLIISLSNKETQLLEYLIRNNDRAISSEELLEHVWSSEINSFSDTVKTHIRTLRRKIDPDKKHIRTIKGKGYRAV